MQNLQVTHGFVRKLTKNIRDAYGTNVPHTKAMELVADALGWKVGPLMHALKQTEVVGDKVHTTPAPWFAAKEIPDLKALGSLTQSAIEGLRRIGGQKTGLVLISGVTGAGKTRTANTLLKQWAQDTGHLGATVGNCLEYETSGKHGDGMIVQNRTYSRQPFRQVLPMLLSYDPAFLLFEDHLYCAGGLTRLDDLMDAIEASRERIVVVTASATSSGSFIKGMAGELSDTNALTFEEAEKRFRQSISATIDVRLVWGERGTQPVFKADVGFNDRGV
ncbi:ATPase, T2SS/T4P/T4SS family [Agrobacterium salinitolerans]|nr:ATPase, T2SS/T4P/T4SS family [Agrobacterium salinitolerans]